MNAKAGASPLLILEEAIHLLRKAPLVTLALYYVGAVPFVLAMLFFLAEMSTSPFAWARCSPYAVALSALYLWMRCWQAVFCSRLRAQISGAEPLRWNRRGLLRLLLLQTAWATYGCVMVPFAMLLVLPLGWAYAFHQNMSAMHLAEICVQEEEMKTWEVYRRAKALAVLWPMQNHLTLLVVSICRMFVWIGVAISLAMLPNLAKSVLGVQSVFTQSYWWMMNTTFIAVTFGITYLCFDPLVKALYVLRCFYGRSLHTGDDLLVGLQRAAWRRRALSAVALFVLLLALPPAPAQDTPRGLAWPEHEAWKPAPDRLPNSALDEAVGEVMTRSEYTWRMPRDLLPPPEDERNIFERFADSITEFIKSSVRWMADGIDAIIRRIFMKQSEEANGIGLTLGAGLKVVTLLFILIMVLLVARLMMKGGRRRRMELEEVDMLPAVPDLEDEAVMASQLPEEEWLALAEQLRRAGETRKAVRAYFLAGLACLGSVDLVRIARFKSNREYQRELRRRAQRFPGIETLFNDNVSRFERIWYGLYEVDAEALDTLSDNANQLKHLVHPQA